MNLEKHALILCAGLLLIGSLRADTILYDNTAAVTTDADSITGAGPLYDSFSTQASSGPISSVKLVLQNGQITPDDPITVSLYADNSTAPGSFIAILGTIDDSTLSTSPAVIDLTLTSNPVLASNTRYWIGLTADSDIAEWDWSVDTSGTGVNGEYFSSHNGAVYSNTEGPYQMEVAVGGTASVPEPSTLFLSSFALLGLAGLRRVPAAGRL